MVKIYTAGLINKPLRQINNKLRSKLSSDMKKYLNTSNDLVNSQELNTFILVSGETQNGKIKFDSELIENIEKGNMVKRFKDYYLKDESRLERDMKNNQELKEVAQIIKDFIKHMNPDLPKKFDSRLRKINSDLPNLFCKLSARSFISLWEMKESNEYRFNLTGLDFPVYTGKLSDIPAEIGTLVDEFLSVNFFATFLTPTLKNLDTMDKVLVRLQIELGKKHFRTNNKGLQTKFELFLRILVSKLSALQELDNLIFRIFNLFDVPRLSLSQYNIHSDFMDFNNQLSKISSDIRDGIAKLQDVSEKIDDCQEKLRDYLDESVNGLTTLDKKDFTEALKHLAVLSVDLFVESEILKNWGD